MTDNTNRGPLLTTGTKAWALTNFGNLVTVERRRCDCVREAEASLRQPWSKCKCFYEVRKVTISEGWDD